MKRFHLLTWLFLSPLLTQCVPDDTNVRVSVHATDNEGNPVPKADIYLDQEKIGTTDVRGNFTKSIALGKKAKINVELKKDSESHYYAPYIGQIETNEDEKQALSVSAVLYSVPKPTFTDAAELVAEDAKANKEEEPKKELPPTELPAETKVQTQSKALESTALIKPDTESAPPEAEANAATNTQSIYVSYGKNALEGVEIYLGDEASGQLKKLCATNKRGRCTFSLPDNQDQGPVNVFTKKKGFVSKTSSIALSPDGKTHLAMIKGESVEIFAVTNTFSYTRGVKDVEVSVQGQAVGRTDKFGHFTYTFTGQKGDMVEIGLRRDGFLPEDYSTDFIISGPLTLVKHFTPAKAPIPRIALLPPRVAGSATQADLSDENVNGVFTELQKAAKESLFAKGAFQEIALSQIEGAAAKAKKSLPQLIKKGWQRTGVKAVADAVIVPTIVMGNQKSIELALISSDGKILAATKSAFSSSAPIKKLFADLSARVMRSFPFEGAIVSKNGEKLDINLGSELYGLKDGDELEVFGNQTDKKGQKKSHTRIGRIKVDRVQGNSAKASIVEQEPRTLMAPGDLIVLKERKPVTNTKSIEFRISAKADGEGEPISQANLYLGDLWLGATDEKGELKIPTSKELGAGVLRVIRYGYRDFTREWDSSDLEKVSIQLEREMTLVRVDSQPQGATVKIDGKSIGKTPLNLPTAIAGGFVKLEIVPEAGYKNFQKVIELSEGTLELTGPQSIKLEKDLRTSALKLLDQGKYELAVSELLAIPKEHSDYLLARHEAGEVLLSFLKRPAEASRTFGEVINDPSVKSYQDKRFVGSFINKAIADLGLVEETTDPKEAAKILLDVITNLNETEPHLRFVPQDQLAQATNHLAYYRALAHQKLWTVSHSPQHLAASLRLWQQYVDHTEEENEKLNPEIAGYLENARVYLKQAKATGNASKQQQSM